jgi:hypothetical protein
MAMQFSYFSVEKRLSLKDSKGVIANEVEYRVVHK